MSRALQLAFFITVAAILVGAVHAYFWLRLVRDTAVGPPWSHLLTALFILLFAGLPLAFVLWRVAPSGLTRWIVVVVYFWMGMAFLLLVFLMVGDLVRLGGWLVGKIAPPHPAQVDVGRRGLLARIVAGAAVALSAGLAAWGTFSAHREVLVRRLKIGLSRLPRGLDGFRLVQLTDLHLGPTLGRDWLEGIVTRVNVLEPDLIAITGDLADGMVDHMTDVVTPLQNLRATHGVYFVTGNHEYYAGVEDWIVQIERLGVRVLRNERVSIGDGEASFDLAGVDDFDAAGMADGHGADLSGALEGRDPSRELVLLAHQPRAIREAARRGVGLQLSGHTHGGQIWPWSYLVYLQQPYVQGLFRHDDTVIYVSSGAGYWGPPMRLGTRGEIVLITLQAGASSP